MAADRMHAARLHTDPAGIDVSLVGRLLAAQFPRWAGLPLKQVHTARTAANAVFRLGPTMAVRLPRNHRAALQLHKEQRWLPHLADRLPLAIPLPVDQGTPAEDYGWPWSVYRWVDGEHATAQHLVDPYQAAADLGAFVAALRQVDAAGGPPPGEHNLFRGLPLSGRDAQTRCAIDSLRGIIDGEAVTAAWQQALAAPAWDRSPGWIHGDLHGVNLLARRGGLSAVTGFGCSAVGDPACDLMVAWTFLSAEHREVFRRASGADDATWARGRGWALTVSLVALTSRQGGSGPARGTIDAVLAEQGR